MPCFAPTTGDASSSSNSAQPPRKSSSSTSTTAPAVPSIAKFATAPTVRRKNAPSNQLHSADFVALIL